MAGTGAELVFFNHALNQDIPDVAKNIDAAVIFFESSVNKEVLDRLPRLKFIATCSTGYDHIDIGECAKQKISVSYVPSYGENTVAEFAFALILTLSRKIFESCHILKEHTEHKPEDLTGFDLKGKTLGVIGTGRIGKHVIKIARGFDMNILANDAFPDENLAKEHNFKYCDLEELLATSDVLTFHVPYMPSTRHLINDGNIFKIKKGALLINTSRGGIVETDALLRALTSGHLGGAGLDVLEEEGAVYDELNFLSSKKQIQNDYKTIFEDRVLIDLPNVIATPHNAYNTKEAIARILDTTVQNIAGFINGKLINLVEVKKLNGKDTVA